MKLTCSTPVFTQRLCYCLISTQCDCMCCRDNTVWPLRSMSHTAARSSYSPSCPLLSGLHWYFQRVCPTSTALCSLTETGFGSFDTEKFVCLSVWSAEVMHRYVCLLGQLSPLTEQDGEEKWWREKYSLMAPSSLCVPLLVEMSRPPGPLPWLPDKMSGVAPHDLVLLVLWQKTTLKGNSGNHKYLGTKELYGVCCKRIYSSLGGDASVSEGSKQPVFTASHVNPPTTLGQAWRTEPNKHFGARNANTTTFSPNRFQKTGVNLASSGPCGSQKL